MRRTAATSWRFAAPTTSAPPDGASWHEAVIRAGKLGYGGPPHGDPSRRDWGATARSLATAQQTRERQERMVAAMTDEQRAFLWSDSSPMAETLRRIASR